MKKIIFMSALAAMATLTSCDSYLDINQDPNKPTEEMVSSADLMPGAEMAISHCYGSILRIQGGYFSEVYAHLNGTSNYLEYSRFNMTATNCNRMYTQLYVNSLANLETVRKKSSASSDWGTYLAATVLRGFVYQTLVDCFGQVPYSEALNADNLTPKYDDGKAVYEGVLAEIDEALSKVSDEDKVCAELLFSDGKEKGSAADWIKFANGLKLRMLMRMANVDSSVLDQIQPLISADNFPEDNVAFQGFWTNSSGQMNPFYSEEFSSSFGSTQTNVCANLAIINTMQVKNSEGNIEYTDPRLAAYFSANSDGKYVGSVSGTQYSGTGTLTKWCRPVMAYDTPVVLMSASEIFFLKAEYYARKDMMQMAKSCYDSAIELSFRQAGIDTGSAEYVARYPFDSSNWKKSIGIQKWIDLAGYNTFEAWCEARRLDYPAFDTTVKGDDFYDADSGDASFTDTGYKAGTFYTPINVYSGVGANKLIERYPFAANSTAGNSNVPKFETTDYVNPIFWGK